MQGLYRLRKHQSQAAKFLTFEDKAMRKEWKPIILEFLFNHPGVTCHEMVAAIPGLHINQVSGRIAELKAEGRVYCCGKIFCVETGAHRSQYRLDPKERKRWYRIMRRAAA